MRSCATIAVCASALVAILSMLYVTTTQRPVEPCAESCACTPEDMDWGSAVNVQCGDRNLRTVPITINDKPVSLLNVSFNVLQTLEEDALNIYESVRYLYLHHCKIVNINEKAFQRLENLTVIDLASNRLTSISANLFSGNQKLDKLILRNNQLGNLQWNTPILNGPSSLSFLDLQSCKLSNISSVTFSLLLNLTFLDISRNSLVLLNSDSLSSHEKLKDVSLENNPWQCGVVFQGLMCWIYSKLAPSYNRTVKCHYMNGTFDIWSPQNWSSLCDSESTRSVTSLDTAGVSTSTKLNLAGTPSHDLDISTSTKLNLACTPSHGLDIFTKTTPTPKVSHKEESGTNREQFIFGGIFALFLLLAFALLLWLFRVYMKCSAKCRENEKLLSHSENSTVENESENTSLVGDGVNSLQENITHDSQWRKTTKCEQENWSGNRWILVLYFLKILKIL